MRKVVIRKSLIRPHLVLGCERIPVILLGVISIIFATNLSVVSIGLGISMWVIGTIILRKFGKIDPYLFGKYLRYSRYSSFYLPFDRETRN